MRTLFSGLSAVFALLIMLSITAPTTLAQEMAEAAPTVAETTSLGTGTFTGKSGHEARGHATIQQTDEGYVLVLGDDFVFDGAPDPKLALGNDGYDSSTLFTPLASNTGQQTYLLPDSIDVRAYNEVWIWCEQYNVPLGVAPLRL